MTILHCTFSIIGPEKTYHLQFDVIFIQFYSPNSLALTIKMIIMNLVSRLAKVTYKVNSNGSNVVVCESFSLYNIIIIYVHD